jgi:hypothetical protein
MMSSKTTSPPEPASTSTPATASTKTQVQAPAALLKVPLRRKGTTLYGIRATAPAVMLVPPDSEVPIKVGDWQIYNGAQCVAVLHADQFPGPYEIVAEGTLTLSLQDRELLEATTGVGTTQTAVDLIKAVQRLARIGIGDVRIPFTPGQLEEIAYRAEKRGITVQRAIQDVIDRISGELFHRPS